MEPEKAGYVFGVQEVPGSNPGGPTKFKPLSDLPLIPNRQATPERSLAMKLAQFTERFIREQQILKNVSPATVQWYRFSFQAFQPVLARRGVHIGQGFQDGCHNPY